MKVQIALYGYDDSTYIWYDVDAAGFYLLKQIEVLSEEESAYHYGPTLRVTEIEPRGD